MAPSVAMLPFAFALWLHRDTERFIAVINLTGLCSEIGSGPVQMRIGAALLLFAVASVFAGIYAWRAVSGATRLRFLGIGATLAMALAVFAFVSVNLGAFIFGCQGD